MKVFVLGSSGMLGNYVSKYISNIYPVINIDRNDVSVDRVDIEKFLSILLKKKGFESGDVIVNCIGLIKPQVDKYGTRAAILINSLFPHILANISEKIGAKTIHITTDCVWSGSTEQSYKEDMPHDALDVYGKTKSLGEPDNCTVIRTSIIGEEVSNSRSLVEWIKSCKNKTANGFTNHLWNGVTCLELSKYIATLIKEDLFWYGVRHIYSPTAVTKYELLKIINRVYNLNIDIKKTQGSNSCNRTLSSKYIQKIGIPELEIQVLEMKRFYSDA